MTKELVKSENGHKIIKHARHDTTHSLLSGHRIKMRYTTPCLVILFLTVVSGDSTSSSAYKTSSTDTSADKATEGNPSKTSTEKTVATNSSNLQSNGDGDDNDLEEDKDFASDDLLMFFETLIDEDKIIIEDDEQTPDNNKVQSNQKSRDVINNEENPVESKISTDLINTEREGERGSKEKSKNSDSDIQFDDSEAEGKTDVPRFGERSRKRKPKVQDDPPLLQLTQGGYDRPYKRQGFRNSFRPKAESSEQSDNVQDLRRKVNNRQPDSLRAVPQITYSLPPQPSFDYRNGPNIDPGFDVSSRNIHAANQILPATSQRGFLDTPSTDLTDYASIFPQQFQQNRNVGDFPNFIRDPSNVGVYQASQRTPFQSPGIMFQTAPQAQPQPLLFDPRGNAPPQFQPNPFTSYPGLENMQDGSTPNYGVFFRNPDSANHPPLQMQSNYFERTPSGLESYQPLNFFSNHPSSSDRIIPQFFRYPSVTEVQNNQERSGDQQLNSDASNEERKTKFEEQEVRKPANQDDRSSVPYGVRIKPENEGDVYMRYPTNKAGYATEENLPPQNVSGETKDDTQQTSQEQANVQADDPYKKAANSVQGDQRIKDSFDFPPEFFRDAPINFGYQRSPGAIYSQYPDRNGGTSRYPSHDFQSRTPFYPIPPLLENNYQFINAGNQQRAQKEVNEIPSCAKEKNVSVCFEDNDYPRNDILYSLNSNSFLADRLSGPDLSENSVVLVERNASEALDDEENYACPVDTKYGTPLRAKNLAGVWKTVVNIQGKFSQSVRMEVCKSLGDSCNYADSQTKTTCVQKYNLQRLLTWSPEKGLYSDVYKIPVACSCQIIRAVQS